MSEAAPSPEAALPRPLTEHQMKGRLAELAMQRDAALNRCAVLAGENAEAVDLVRFLQGEVERLRSLLATQPGSSAAH